MDFAIVTPWVYKEEINAFLSNWNISEVPPWLVLQCDENREGCGVTKNKGVAEAMRRGADVVVILDGDCYPSAEATTLEQLAELHIAALEPQPVEMFATVTDPPSRGTPYFETTIPMPVAASMGFWRRVGDYCAPRQLTYGALHPMNFHTAPIFGRYFPLCGMNLAFRPAKWLPWCSFIDVPRFDDIWMGWLWQRHAYTCGWCFNLNGPLVTHSRQSNVWKNLADEATYLESNESLWIDIATHESDKYADLVSLLPIKRGTS